MAKAAEQAFTRWTEWTVRRHTTYGLGDTPAKVRETFWNLIARADREPIPFEGQTLLPVTASEPTTARSSTSRSPPNGSPG
ncbi:hypothetical protein ACFVRD_43965 [Streptomyces sp. NPDC057908]|uniref:hypothetical protein n=1 Tax=Streptomyces sp. NPDC057908 TaxID=3346276 RepID=UPI0036E69F84